MTSTTRAMYFDKLVGISLLFYVPYLFKVSLEGASLEFSNPDAYFRGLSNSEGSIVQQAVTLFGFLIAFLVAWHNRVTARQVIWSLAPVLIFAGVCLASVAWSDYPELTIRRLGRLCIDLLSVSMIASAYADRPLDLVRALYIPLLVVAVASTAMLAVPSRSFVSNGFIGVFAQKLYIGQFAVAAAPIFLVAMFRREVSSGRALPLLGLACLMVILPLSNSKTAWVCIPVAMAGALFLHVTLRDRKLFLFLAAIAFAAAFFGFLYIGRILDPEFLADKLFSDSSFTGRDVIWKFVFDRVDDRNVLGVGYGAMWQTGSDVVARLREGYKIYGVNNAHNGYVDIYAQTGFVGLCILFVVLALMLVRLLKSSYLAKSRSDEIVACLGFYFFFSSLFMNTTDTSFYWAFTSQWFMMILAFCLAGNVAWKDADVGIFQENSQSGMPELKSYRRLG